MPMLSPYHDLTLPEGVVSRFRVSYLDLPLKKAIYEAHKAAGFPSHSIDELKRDVHSSAASP
jgi:hypothetical protein